MLTVHRYKSYQKGKNWSQNDTTIFERITHAKYTSSNIATQQMHQSLNVPTNANCESNLRKIASKQGHMMVECTVCTGLLTMLDDQFEYDLHLRLHQFHDQSGHIGSLWVYYCVCHFHSPQFEASMTFLA